MEKEPSKEKSTLRKIWEVTLSVLKRLPRFLIATRAGQLMITWIIVAGLKLLGINIQFEVISELVTQISKTVGGGAISASDIADVLYAVLIGGTTGYASWRLNQKVKEKKK